VATALPSCLTGHFVFHFAPRPGSGQFAHLVELNHVCGEGLGSVEFELMGNPNHYLYYWTHGPKTLRLENLVPGNYTFVVMDLYGCVEIYEVEILELDGCILMYHVYPTHNPCLIKIVIKVFSNGVPINESNLNIVWSDGDPSGLIREVSLAFTATYCVDITLKGSNGATCCHVQQCIPVEGNPRCRRENMREVIVNEFYRGAQGASQFIELLVIGDAVCGDTFDLRGFHVDDNNGYLIPGNGFLSANNLDGIGINPGYLTFSEDTAWSNVPVGSLIVLYSHLQQPPPNMPPSDPSDTNDDGVYVVPVEDETYFYGGSGTWNQPEKLLLYEGYLMPPSWGLVDISPVADGVQVRYPDGSFSHGLSQGVSAFSAVNSFPLWITANSSTNSSCRFIGEDYLLKADFTCTATEDSLQSPGLPNSLENAAFINLLHNCPGGLKTEKNNLSFPNEKVKLKVYPNPFSDEIRLDFSNDQANGKEARATIFSVSGQPLFTDSWPCEPGENTRLLKTGEALPPGVFILQFTFPSGERQNERIVRISSR